MIAEFHDVLAQSYERLPYVSQIFTGPQNGIWALVNHAGPDSCGSEEANDLETLDTRVVKIMKYNRIDIKNLL